MTKQQYIDKRMIHLEMTEELKNNCIELAKTYRFVSKALVMNEPKWCYYCYQLKCKENGFTYYHILDGVTGILSKKDRDELMLEVKTKEQLAELSQFKLKKATIMNPNQYIKLCYPVYEDMIIYGLDSFEVSIAHFDNYYIGCLWAWGDIMLGGYGSCYDWRTTPYNLIDDWYFSGIKCIETQEIFNTPGQAAKAVGLKSKTSILKALNDYNKTAANYHWVCLDKP